MTDLATQFSEMADQLLALGGIDATLVKQPSDQNFNLTTLKTQGSTPPEFPVVMAHMKATASRLSGFGLEFTPGDQARRLEFYYLKGADPTIGDSIRFADGSTMTVMALSKVDIKGVVIIYQLLLEA